jgi:multidrug efflux system membrane fusion protein
MRWRRIAVYGLIGFALAGAVAYLAMPAAQDRPRAGGPGGRFRATPNDQAVPTLASAARTTNVPVYLDGVGTTRALNTVTVRSQVDGKLIKLNFREGQDVERGDELAKIDPTIYQAQYDQAVAKKAQDEALLANARRDLERYTRLAATNAGPPQQADTQRSLVAQFEAQVNADQAAIDNARGVLDYTTIAAPISGRIGMRLVDIGNIVHASDAGGLLVITQLRPISVLFSLPQQQLPQVNKAFSKGALSVEALGADNKTPIDRGTLQVVDNQIDQTTGTIKLKAEFPNRDLQLWPGQFVSVRLLVDTLTDVVVVPTAAVQRGPNGTFVYVVRDNDTVAMRPVTISNQDENLTVVTNGVQAGERVVTTSFNQLTDGHKVVVSAGEPGQPPAAAPSGDTQQRNRRRQRNQDSEAQAQQPPRDGAAQVQQPAREGAAQAETPRREGERRSERTEGTSRTP